MTRSGGKKPVVPLGRQQQWRGRWAAVANNWGNCGDGEEKKTARLAMAENGMKSWPCRARAEGEGREAKAKAKAKAAGCLVWCRGQRAR